MFKRGDKVFFKGEDSHFEGRFLTYIDKLQWTDEDGVIHPPARRCLVQQKRTGMVFVKPDPKETNRVITKCPAGYAEGYGYYNVKKTEELVNETRLTEE